MVSLYIRTTENGKRVYKHADMKKQATEGMYFLRYDLGGKRYWRSVGKFLKFALVELKKKELEMLNNEDQEAPKPKAAADEKLTLKEQREAFLAEKKATKKRDRTPLDAETLEAYSQQTEEFLSVCNRDYSEEVIAQDLRDYMNALEKRGLKQWSVCNHYTSIASFLKFCGVDHKKLLKQNERPVPPDNPPEFYEPEEMDKFFAVITDERQRLAFEVLLKTGLRMREMATLEWNDFKFGEKPTVTVQSKKPHLRFRTKTGKHRTITLEKALAGKLKSWRDRNIGKRLVFGTDKDKEDRHWHRYSQKTAKKAGMDPKKFWVHKFRDTYATWTCRAREIDLPTLKYFLGHASITMTEKYLGAGDPEGEYAQSGINSTFAGFAIAAVV